MKYHWRLFSFILCLNSLGINNWVANAIELADGTTYFLHPPRLLGAISSQDGTNVWSATYYFTLKLPENAGEPLQKVAIAQEGGLGRPLFDISNMEVFEGTRDRPGKRLPIQNTKLDAEMTALSIQFTQPVLPGKTITIRLYPVRNPGVAGTYLYGVTAFPLGKKPHGQYLGVGQIRIHDSNLD